jgi:putative sporulation protein YtxC
VRLLSIGIIEPIEGFEDRLDLELKILRDEGIEIIIKLIERSGANYYFCNINDDILLEGNFNDIKSNFHHCIANALSDVILNQWEPKLIKKIIKNNYFYFDQKEHEKIFEFTQDILNFNEVQGRCDLTYQIKRKSYILHKIKEYIGLNSTIILDGFIKFRLREYMGQLEEAVDKAIDEYLMDKEYREFIKLLKYFVELQEPKKDLINVILKNNEIYLFDEMAKPIGKDYYIDEFARENPEVNVDDVLVSTLINMAPQKIIIHGFTGKEKPEVINAIYNIFEGKVSFCSHCDICFETEPIKLN